MSESVCVCISRKVAIKAINFNNSVKNCSGFLWINESYLENPDFYEAASHLIKAEVFLEIANVL